MIKQNKLVPKRRFEEFEKEWRKSKFLEIVFRLSEKSKEDIPRVEFEDINSGLGTLNKDIYKKKSEKIGVKFNSGDILFGKLRPYLKNWLLADFDGIAVGDFWVLRPNDNNSELIYALIQGEKYQQIANLSTGTKMPRSDWEIVSNTKFALPASNKEQQKIGQFFKHLDEMIAIQQRKIDKTKALKSAYLAEMFPAEGERIPKRRFEGFTTEWEVKILGDIGQTFTGLSGKTKEDFGHGNAEFVTYMNVFNNPISNIAITENVEIDIKQDEVKYGDVLFTTSSETPHEVGMSSVWLDNRPNVYLNSFCFGYRININIDYLFIAYLFRSSIMRNQMEILAQGISRYNISKNKVMGRKILLPDKKEQQKIGQFFKHLDDTILIHQQKLEKLKATKQAYLHEMFV